MGFKYHKPKVIFSWKFIFITNNPRQTIDSIWETFNDNLSRTAECMRAKIEAQR